MNGKLYVGNIPKFVTTQELTALFTQAGEVVLIDLIKDHYNGMSKGFAFVTMGTQNEAEKAILMFNTYTLNDQVIKVDKAKISYRV